MRKKAYTSDELAQLRGNGTVLSKTGTTGTAKNHRLQSASYPRRKRESRNVTVTLPNGVRRVLTSTLRDPAKEKRDRQYAKRLRDSERKREQFATGAEYAETWQTAQASESVDTHPEYDWQNYDTVVALREQAVAQGATPAEARERYPM